MPVYYSIQMTKAEMFELRAEVRESIKTMESYGIDTGKFCPRLFLLLDTLNQELEKDA